MWNKPFHGIVWIRRAGFDYFSSHAGIKKFVFFSTAKAAADVVDGVLTKDVESGIYNMGDDEALSTNELIEEICLSLGKKPRIWRLPKGLMIFLATVGGWLHLPLNRERLRKLTEDYVSSNAKIKAALGVNRMPVGAREGLKVTLESFKQNPSSPS